MSLFCPLCAQQTHVYSNNKNIKDTIYKYLKIKIKEEYIDRLCLKCDETLTVFDEFAEKCWAAQKIISENVDSVKKEDVSYEVKVENFSDNEKKYSISQNKLMSNDPLSKRKKTTIKRKCNVRSIKKKLNTRSEATQDEVDKYIEVKIEKFSDDDINDDCDESIISNSSVIDSETIVGEIKSEIRKSKRKTKKYKKEIEESLIKIKCHLCDFQARFWHSLASHCSKEHSEKPQVLCICGEYLSDVRTMRNHARSHEEMKKIACEHCDKKFRDNSALHLHKASHIPKEECTLSCSMCPKKFPTSVHLMLHIKRHQREKQECDVCGKILASKSSLKMHKLAVHDNIRDHICDTCGHSFVSRSTLFEHQLKHTEEKNFKCEKCNESFKSKRNLSQHEKASHSDLVFQCPECPVVLKNSRCFRKHKLVHMDVYKYSCSLCGKQFKRGYTLKEHMNSHDGIRPYSCQWCAAAYSNNRSLKNHKLHEHPDKFTTTDKFSKPRLDYM